MIDLIMLDDGSSQALYINDELVLADEYMCTLDVIEAIGEYFNMDFYKDVVSSEILREFDEEFPGVVSDLDEYR